LLMNLGFAGGGTAPVSSGYVKHRGFTVNVGRLLSVIVFIQMMEHIQKMVGKS
jgi:hypothetical protein